MEPIVREKREGEPVTIYLSGVEWRAFRLACVRRRTSASKEISRFIREQMAAWAIAATSLAVPIEQEE